MMISWNVPRKAQDSTSVYRNHGGMLYLCTCIQEAAYFVKVTKRTGPRKGSPYSEKPGTFLQERIDLSPSLKPPFSALLTLTQCEP